LVDQSCGMYVSCAGIFAYSGISFAISERMLGVAKALVRPGNIRDLFVYRTMEFTFHYLRGDWDEEHVIDDDLVEQALRYGQVWDVTLYLGIECDRRVRRGDFAAAQRLLDKLADIKDTYGYAYAGSNCNGMRVILLLEERQLEDALRATEQHYAARHEGTLKVMTLGMSAQIRVFLGDREGAAAALSRAADTIKRAGVVSPWHQCGYHVAQLLFDVTALETCAQRGDRAGWGSLRRAAVRSARRAQRTANKVAK